MRPARFMWTDTSGRNFRSYLQTIDVGFNDAWCYAFSWDDDGVYFFTQYEPAVMCDDDPCLHLPQRCHFDNYEVNYL